MVAVVGPWAKDKLDKLGRYLEYYTTVLKNQAWCRTIYVDAFAGGGRAIVRQGNSKSVPETGIPLFDDEIPEVQEQTEFLDGSPRVALAITNPFARYVFIEPDPERSAELRALEEEIEGGRNVTVLETDAASGIRWVLSQKIGRNSHRGVAFLDPFGARLEWESVAALAELGIFEVVINFALNMAIKRMLPNDGIVPPRWSETLDRYFGTHEWYDEVYILQGDDLFGSPHFRKREDYGDRLLALYRRRLEEAFGFVSTPRLIRNTRDVPLYYLIWAGPNKKGQQGANYILQMGEPAARKRPSRGRDR